MDLQGKRFPRIEQLGQDGETRAVGNVAPEDRVAFFNPKLMQGSPAPGPLPNDALRFRAVNNFPRFADLFPGGSRLPKRLSSRRPPQIRSMKRGSKTSGDGGWKLHFGGEISPE